MDTIVLMEELFLFLIMSFVFSLYKDVYACGIHVHLCSLLISYCPKTVHPSSQGCISVIITFFFLMADVYTLDVSDIICTSILKPYQPSCSCTLGGHYKHCHCDNTYQVYPYLEKQRLIRNRQLSFFFFFFPRMSTCYDIRFLAAQIEIFS